MIIPIGLASAVVTSEYLPEALRPYRLALGVICLAAVLVFMRVVSVPPPEPPGARWPAEPRGRARTRAMPHDAHHDAHRDAPHDRPHPGPGPGPWSRRGEVPALDLESEIHAIRWDAWSAQNQLRLLDAAPDPGNAGADLTLFEVTAGPWVGTRLVQVTDASTNEDGVRERHALPVPPGIGRAVDAIAATWGLAPHAYRPERHT